MLHLVKPDLIYYKKYNEMMKEWNESNTQIAPWFLEKQFENEESFLTFFKKTLDLKLTLDDIV